MAIEGLQIHFAAQHEACRLLLQIYRGTVGTHQRLFVDENNAGVVAPFPGFRDLGLTAGLGLLACMVSSFLVLPALLLALYKGRGTFAPRAGATRTASPVRPWKPVLALVLVLAALAGSRRLRWEEDLRRFRQVGNPALALQEELSHALGAGLQPLALQIPLDDPERLPQVWNRIVLPLRRENLPMPEWKVPSPEVKRILGSETWYHRALQEAGAAGLDPVALERALSALRASAGDPSNVPRSIQALMPPIKAPVERSPFHLFGWHPREQAPAPPAADSFTLPLRLSEAARERIQGEVEAAGGRMVGTRPLFRAIKSVAKDALRQVILLALAAVLAVVALFGRRPRFLLLALLPLAASQLGALGILGLTGEPLTFLSLVAIPIALGVSVDTAMNLLHRARLEPRAAARVARVNAVCAGTTLAGFGGLVFSGYRGLRGLGLASLGGVAMALLVTQWVLPWLLEKWPLGRRVMKFLDGFGCPQAEVLHGRTRNAQHSDRLPDFGGIHERPDLAAAPEPGNAFRGGEVQLEGVERLRRVQCDF